MRRRIEPPSEEEIATAHHAYEKAVKARDLAHHELLDAWPDHYTNLLELRYNSAVFELEEALEHLTRLIMWRDAFLKARGNDGISPPPST